MTDSPSPAASVLHRGLDLMLAKDMPGFLALWHDDATAEFPFAPTGFPRRLDGIAAITDYLIDYPERLDIAEFSEPTVHQSTDPTVVIAEFTSTGTVVATGQPYQMPYIAVLTVRDGKIAHYRDYWDPIVAAAVATNV
ncbi:nuclear transport factor 2 family protein [Micromonospora sp. NBC_01813]|uniref:nuclear transport factor 2 family protein n=1 Tax=Micromonospora sp. NBC_01813 TaxID=2975988 RepID=UPI002DD94D5D|nr:nuclear transport factor 2 family protein [Micromonospora sp. NBC_01813]WSA08148.1 nuclear transport factor 2 family protein [Micromonospora sp. NBC_01813]